MFAFNPSRSLFVSLVRYCEYVSRSCLASSAAIPRPTIAGTFSDPARLLRSCDPP